MKNGHKRQLTTTKKKPPTERIIKDIRSLRDSGKSDIEIRELLGIELRTFQRYTKTIYEQDQEVWISITRNELASELLKLRSCLNDSYKIAKQLSEDTKLECEDRLSALQSMLDSRISMVQLLRDVDMIREIEIQPSQNTRPYVEKYDWKVNAEQVLENER